MLKRHWFKALAILAVALAASGAQAQEVSLKFHTFMAPGSNVWVNMLLPWMEKVSKESGGRIKFQQFPAMQLGGTPPQLYDQVKDGVVDVVWTLPGYSAGRFPSVEVFELPFMMTSAEAAARALWDYTGNQGKADFKDVHVIATHTHGPGYLHTREKQVKSLADLKGMKIRGPTRVATKAVAALGATPVGMPLPQIPESLNKGVIDGAMLPWEVVPSIKVQEIVKFHTETDPKAPALYTSVFILAMNKAKYDALPADLKKVIDNNSGAETSVFLGRTQEAGDGPGRKSAQDRKNTIYVMPAAEVEQWRKATEPVIAEWIKDMDGKNYNGKALVDAARALMVKYTK